MHFEHYNPTTDQVENWEIEYRILDGRPERRIGLPEDWSPAEEPEIRGLKIFNQAGQNITSQADYETIQQIEEEIWQQELISA